jgi:hypothetical protein
MALVAILSTQLLDHQFIPEFTSLYGCIFGDHTVLRTTGCGMIGQLPAVANEMS